MAPAKELWASKGGPGQLRSVTAPCTAPSSTQNRYTIQWENPARPPRSSLTTGKPGQAGPQARGTAGLRVLQARRCSFLGCLTKQKASRLRGASSTDLAPDDPPGSAGLRDFLQISWHPWASLSYRRRWFPVLNKKDVKSTEFDELPGIRLGCKDFDILQKLRIKISSRCCQVRITAFMKNKNLSRTNKTKQRHLILLHFCSKVRSDRLVHCLPICHMLSSLFTPAF